MHKHSCDAIVVSCIDFRFQNYLRDWLDKTLKEKSYDYVGFAGSTKDLNTILKQIDISVRLHSIKETYLIHHEDCGAYGSQSTPQRHASDLTQAKNQIQLKYPSLKVFLFYLHLNGEFEKVD